MKNLITLCLAYIIILSFGGQAAAYFEEGHLIQVIYERGGTKEIVTDLGERSALFGTGLTAPYGGPIVTKPMSNVLTDLGATSWENVYVAYFMRYNQGGDNFVWVSGAPSGTQTGKGSGGNALISQIGDLAGANMQTGEARNVNLQSSPTSFSSLFGTAGTFEGFLTTPAGEANLAALATPGGSVTQYLYYYNAPTNARNTYDGLAVLTVRTIGNGTTEMKQLPAPPVPPQSYLLSVFKVGAGTVTSNDRLINCGSLCSRQYPQGAAVYLNALPDDGTFFAGWSGDCAGTGNCALDMNSDRSVTAIFSPQGITVAPISPDDGVTIDVSSLYNPILFAWNSGEAFSRIELQFSADNFASMPVKIKKKGYVTETPIPSGSWKKILKLPGSQGGIVFWRVAGIRADGGIVYSAIRTCTVQGPEAVGTPRIEHVSRTLLPPPVLAWANNHNVKFKVWFGNYADFATAGMKKKALTFTIKDPSQHEGFFTKQLTAGQWKAIRRVVGDTAGQTVFWYVESWDAIKRYNRSEVMSFILTE